MTSDDYRWIMNILTRSGWYYVSDFYHRPPAHGAKLLYLEGPDDGPGFGPWWTGGRMTAEVAGLGLEEDTYQPDLAQSKGY